MSIVMFVCSTVLYAYMKLLRNDVNNLFDNKHVRIKIYREFHHGISYIANKGCYVSISYITYNSMLILHILLH